MSQPRKRCTSAKRSAGTPITIHILDGAEVLPDATLENLPSVVRLMTSLEQVVIVNYDAEARQLVFYRRPEWILAGRQS